MFLFFCLLLSVSVWGASPRLEIDFHSEASVSAPVILLRDLADLRGSEKEVREAGKIEIGKSPAPGRSRNYSSRTLRIFFLEGRALTENAEILGSRVVRVTAASEELDGDDLHKRIVDFVRGKLQEDTLGLEVLLKKEFSSLKVPVGKYSLLFSAGPHFGRIGHQSVHLQILQGEREVRNLFIPLVLERKAMVAVSCAPLSRGKVLNKKDVCLEERTTTRLMHAYYRDLSRVVGKALRRSVRSGRILRRTDLVRPLVVKRGEQVELLSRVGNSLVSVLGTSKQDGREDDLISVLNVASGKKVKARLDAQGKGWVLD